MDRRTSGKTDTRMKKQIVTFRSFANAPKKYFRKKCYREYRHTFYVQSSFFWKSYHIWDNLEKFCDRGMQQITIWRIRIACWILRATNTDWVSVIHIAFPLQLWLQEGASILRYTYIAYLVHSKINERDMFKNVYWSSCKVAVMNVMNVMNI